jgi:alanine racemase
MLRETRAYVDLDAVDHNLRVFSGRVPGSRLMPAVKADAYGHGIEAVGAAAERFGAELLAVACLEEYQVLRDQGITLPVLILEDIFPEEIEVAIREGARLSAGSLEYARKLSETATRLGTTVVIHVNLDTGMGRMGLLSDDPARDLAAISGLSGITLEGVYTHFPGSDERDKSFSHEQIRRFEEILSGASREGVRPKYRHVANSGALIDFPAAAAFDLVRPGVSMYGMFPSEEVDQSVPLRPVMKVVSRIVKLNRYDRDWTVGYGRTWKVRPGAVIGIVPIGYGDGYPRLLSNRGQVLVRGRRVPIAGRVSMDMTAIDLTEIAPEARLGEEVVLMGSSEDETIDAMELARLTQTITYEITCGFTPRVSRVYLQGGEIVATKTQRDGYRRES